jgi:hypothetical protein
MFFHAFISQEITLSLNFIPHDSEIVKNFNYTHGFLKEW